MIPNGPLAAESLTEIERHFAKNLIADRGNLDTFCVACPMV